MASAPRAWGTPLAPWRLLKRHLERAPCRLDYGLGVSYQRDAQFSHKQSHIVNLLTRTPEEGPQSVPQVEPNTSRQRHRNALYALNAQNIRPRRYPRAQPNQGNPSKQPIGADARSCLIHIESGDPARCIRRQVAASPWKPHASGDSAGGAAARQPPHIPAEASTWHKASPRFPCPSGSRRCHTGHTDTC